MIVIPLLSHPSMISSSIERFASTVSILSSFPGQCHEDARLDLGVYMMLCFPLLSEQLEKGHAKAK